MICKRWEQNCGITGGQASYGARPDSCDSKGYSVHVFPKGNGLREQRTFLPLHGSKSGSSVVIVITNFLHKHNDQERSNFRSYPARQPLSVLSFSTAKSGSMHTLKTHLSSPCALLSSPLALHGSWNGLKYICTSCDDKNLLISKVSSKVKPRFHHCMRE